MAVPEELIGVWRRTGLIIDGRRTIDYCDVVWVQSADWFVDIRLRISDPEPPLTNAVEIRFACTRAFAGIATWQAPVLTWQHLIDVATDPPMDSNPITWANGGILERGSHVVDGRHVPWVEEWVRISDQEPIVSVSEDCRQVGVAVNDLAVNVRDDRPDGPFVASRKDRIEGQWQEVGRITRPLP